MFVKRVVKPRFTKDASTCWELRNETFQNCTRNRQKVGNQRRTFTRGTTLVRSHDRMRAAGYRTGYEHAHLPTGVAVAVTAAVVPAVAFLVPVPV